MISNVFIIGFMLTPHTPQNLAWDEDAQTRGVHPIVALRDFILDEESALYPRTLIVGYIGTEIGPDAFDTEEGDFDPEEGQIAETDLLDIVAQLGNQLRSKVNEVTRVLRLDVGWTASWARGWISDIISGDLEAAASLLVALLPNLRNLRIIDGWRYLDLPPFYAILERILETAADLEQNLKGLNSFKHLVEVDLQGLDDDDGPDFATCSIFSALPSIRTVKGRFVSGESERSLRYITTLELYQSAIDRHGFYKCIREIKSLQRFTYDFSAATALVDATPWQPRVIVEYLRWYASKSLVHLELTGIIDVDDVEFRSGEPFIGNLRAFKVLETLRLETMMLYKEVEEIDEDEVEIIVDDRAGGRTALVEPERLVDILPASAKRLRLVGGLSDDEALAMLADVVELKNERIPNFRRIFFEDVDPPSEILSVCEKASISVKFCGRV